jgi:flagellar basal body-associated protein FliL
MFGNLEPAPKPADPSVIVEFGSLETERPPEPPPEPPRRAREPSLEITPLELASAADATPRLMEAARPEDDQVTKAPWERAAPVPATPPAVAAEPARKPDEEAGPSAPARPRGPSKIMLVLVGLVALLSGVALVVLLGGKTKKAPEAPAAPKAEAASTTASAPSPALVPSEAATVPAVESAAPVASAAPTESAAPDPSAVPAQSAAAPASAAPPEPSAVLVSPTEPTPPFDINKLPAERAGLYVRSSVKAQVFVHGTEYGETNTWLTTSCGIRFVRLGRKLGDFIEPGSSHVVKCGRANEIRIEP